MPRFSVMAFVVMVATLVAVVFMPTNQRRHVVQSNTAGADPAAPAVSMQDESGKTIEPLKSVEKQPATRTATDNVRARAEAMKLLPTAEEQWQAEPIDPDFVTAHESGLWQQIVALPEVASTTVQCRSRTCKVDVSFRPGSTLTTVDTALVGFSPYRRTAEGWTLFFNPDLAENAVD